MISCNYVDCTSATVTNSLQLRTKVINANTADATAFMTTDDLLDIRFSDFQFSDGHGIELITATPAVVESRGNTFTGYGGTGGTNDTPSSGSTDAAIYNNKGRTTIINVTEGGDSPSIRNAAATTTTVNNAVTLTVRGVTSNNEPTTYARVSMHLVSDNTEIFKTNADVVDELNSGFYKGTASYNYTGNVQVRVKARYSSAGGTKYKNFETIQTITADGLDVTAVWIVDPIAN